MTPFETETWLWFGVVMVVVMLRFLSRILHFKSCFRFQAEDYLMLFVSSAYLTFIVLITIAINAQTNLIDPSDVPALTPEDIVERTYGSKVILGVEQTMCMVQWGTKICLLFLYYRLTENLVQNLFVRAVGVYVVATFIVMEVLYLGYWCRPFYDYWQVPTDNFQCTTAYNHLIVNLSFNLTSDILIMSIPLPLLLKARLEIKRKILLCFPFTLGFFSIICAALSKHVSFTNPFSPEWSFWYVREASCIMVVANMPYTWGLIRRTFKLQSFWGRGNSESPNGSEVIEGRINTGMGIMGGEVEQIHGLAVTTDSEAPTTNTEKPKLESKWTKVSQMFVSEKSSSKPPQIQIREHCEKASPTGTQSDESTTENHWQSINWSEQVSGVEVVQVPTNQSRLASHTLLPPSQALLPPSSPSSNSNNRRFSAIDIRRTSTSDIRRFSTFSSMRSRASVSEISRQSTRNSAHVDAIDRLYRLDDEDLVADLEAARPYSHRSNRSGFD